MPDDLETMVAKETVAHLYRGIVDGLRTIAGEPGVEKMTGPEALLLAASCLERAIEKEKL